MGRGSRVKVNFLGIVVRFYRRNVYLGGRSWNYVIGKGKVCRFFWKFGINYEIV